jgi:ribosomal protein S18 acetylase RimI-like enzyme
MTILELDYNKLSASELEALLVMFVNSYAKEDYMASREVTDLEVLNKILQNKDLLHFIAYEDKTPVAYCQVIYKAESVNFNSGAKINAVAVLPDKRNQGVGTELLTSVIETLKQKPKIRNIFLDVAKDNKVAIELYKKLGFEKVGELKDIFTKDGVLIDIETFSLHG